MLIAAPLVYLAAIAAFAASLAYLISLGPFDGLNFSLLVTRGAQVILLFSLIPLARYLRLTASEIGFPASPRILLMQLASGFAFGVLMLSVHVAMLLRLGAIKPNPEVVFGFSEVFSTTLKVIWLGFLIATMEELIFRGTLLASLRRIGSASSAAGVTAVYYALLHFVKSDLRPSGAEVEWSSGFKILGDGVLHMASEMPVDCLLALFLAGLFLAAVRLIFPRALSLCIGIHAGWVVVIKVARRLTNPDPLAPLAYLVGPYDQIIGYGAAAWIAFLLILLLTVADRTRRAPRSPR